ncbi:hypothetical protein BsWGS_14160 [Bradybaena similaris]
MSEEHEQEEDISSTQHQIEEEIYKVRPPNKKKFDEDLDKLISQIREKEGELEKYKSAGSLNIASELKNLKSERSATITKRKQTDVELERLKKIIPEKMCQLGQLESSLIYKSEEKINMAIQRLEYNLNVQHFKLAEEKKIVCEIDRLKRSKKTLVQYLALRQEINGIRDLQRHMREERDNYFHVVGKLNSNEDSLRKSSSAAKTSYSLLKMQIDDLYESKRQLVSNFKKQSDEYQDGKEKPRRGSWKKREDYRKSATTERRKQPNDREFEKMSGEKHLNWCNSLIRVLSRYNNLAVQDPSTDSLSPTSSIEEPEPAEEIDDGQYVLLKKSGESQDHSQGVKKPSRKNRRPRKQGSVKKITLSSDMLQQLAELGLKAPKTMSEVTEALESLKLKKVLLETEQHPNEVASDAGISATESMICEMSRQASKTESYEGAVDTDPGDQVYVDLLRKCQESHGEQPEGWEAMGAVGGYDNQSGEFTSYSNSNLESKMGINEDEWSSNAKKETLSVSPKGVRASEGGRQEMSLKTVSDDRSESSTTDVIHIPRHALLRQGNIATEVESLNSVRNNSTNNADSKLLTQAGEHAPKTSQWKKLEKPVSLFISPPSSLPVPQCIPSAAPLDFSSLKSTMSPGNAWSPVNSRSVCSPKTDHHLSAGPASSLHLSASPTKPHQTLAARLSTPSTSTQQSPNLPKQLSQPTLILDGDDFPPLSHSLGPSRRGSNLSTRSSGGSSSHLEHPLQQPLSQQSLSHQMSSLDISEQTHTLNAFPVQQTISVSVSEELPSSHLVLQKSSSLSPQPGSKSLSVSQIPVLNKLSTEKWVESSVAFANNLNPVHCEGNTPTIFTESTRL